jgi:hypothetical protein
MRPKSLAGTLFLLHILITCSAPCWATNRVALVIGNANYQNSAFLANPINDSADVAAALERLGFSVTRQTNGTYQDLRLALIGFGQLARDAEVAIVYFAGHGIEVGGINWLIPIDAALRSATDIDKEAISLQMVMDKVRDARFALIILDACRNNPFIPKMAGLPQIRSVSRGFVRVSPTPNMMVAYSAREGTTAADGIDRNSPFTAALLDSLKVPSLEIELLFRRVRDRVVAATKGEQQPFAYGSLSKHGIYLNSSPALAQVDSDLVTKCDLLASSPFDRDKPAQAPGVPVSAIDPISGATACAEAIQRHPTAGRFYYQAGRVALLIKNYPRAHELLEKAAQLGHALAANDLGLIYANGWGYERDAGNARSWLARAVAAGDPMGMFSLGYQYYSGSDGGEIDYEKARLLFEQAASKGNRFAMNNLGVLYEIGRGVGADAAAAKLWYEKASDLGNEVAMGNLASLYERGVGAPKDEVLARHWYEKAAAAGNKDAAERLKTLQ